MKIKLSPFKKIIFVGSISIAVIFFIHFNADSIIHRLATLSSIVKILLFFTFIVVYGLLVAYSKVVEAPNSRQFRTKSQDYGKPLIIEISFKGFIKFLSLMIQIIVFSFLFYFVGGHYVSFAAKWINGTLDPTKNYSWDAMILLVVLFMIVSFISIKILEKLGIIDKIEKDDTHNS